MAVVLSDIKFINGNYTCFSSRGIASLSDRGLLTFLYWECDSRWQVITAVVSTLTGILIIGLPIIIYKKRWRIRHTFFNLQERLLPVNRSDFDSQSFTFDAFVLYNSRDRFWVHDVLRLEMEGTFGFKLCLHFRDFEPGVAIIDNVADAIRKSRKVLAVLSPNFLSSDWCIDELHMSRSYDQNKIILLMLDSINAGEVPALVSVIVLLNNGAAISREYSIVLSKLKCLLSTHFVYNYKI